MVHDNSQRNKSFLQYHTVTFATMQRTANLFGKTTFVMVMDYDDNKMFLKLDQMKNQNLLMLSRCGT